MTGTGGFSGARAGLVVALVALASAFGPGLARASADVGVEDFSYAPVGGSPTGSKPESKLWLNDGVWWSTMFDATSGAHHIFRLNGSVWADTGTAIDARDSSRADALWDGESGKLYVASHGFTSTAAASTSSNGRLWRFSYDSATKRYTRDSAFPVSGLPINNIKSETLVIDNDTGGRLWATWTDGSHVFVSSTNGTDTQWGTPFQVPGSTGLTTDDISSLIAFSGQIGVMWSNQADHKFWFATHSDTSAPAAGWTAAPIPSSLTSDDHINLKAFEGKVYAAVKTSETVSTAPLTQLLVRATAGTWTASTFGTVRNSHTRPIVLVDTSSRVVRMFATGPQPPSTSGQSSGDIREKDAPLDAISFPSDPSSASSVAGIGTPVISDTGSPDMNNVTSTKQNVDASTGLVVMANNDVTNRYWHAALGGAGAPPPPPPPPPTGTPLTFSPVADAQVKSTSPTTNYGTLTTIRTHAATAGGPPDYVSYLRFTVTGVTAPVQSVTLRLFVTDASPDGGNVFRVSDIAWPEATITWNTRPAPDATPLAPVGAVVLNTYRGIALPASAVPSDGTYSFMIASGSTNSAIYSSREASANRPQLVVTTG